MGEIFGRQIATELMQIQSSEGDLQLSGLIGLPGLGRATRHEMITFVNGRPVDSRTLNYALIESYHDSLPKGRYPVAFVFLDLDPAAVDVNVHPAKREIRFRSEPQVRGFVIRSILQRLREFGAASAPLMQGSPLAPLPTAAAERWPGAGNALPPPVVPAAFQSPFLTRAVPVPQAGSESQTRTPLSPVAPVSFSTPPQAALPSAALPPAQAGAQLKAWRFIGLAHGTYALFETPAGVVILDRRAAQERIWFERLKEQYGAGSVPCQSLLLPLPLELDPISSALLLDRVAFLEKHGFEVAQFGRNFFRIEAIPDWMEPTEAEGFCRDLLSAFREGRLLERDGRLADEEFARVAAGRAVRMPAQASEAEMLGFLRDLFATSLPLTSPAGRPTLVEWSLGDFIRRFQK